MARQQAHRQREERKKHQRRGQPDAAASSRYFALDISSHERLPCRTVPYTHTPARSSAARRMASIVAGRRLVNLLNTSPRGYMALGLAWCGLALPVCLRAFKPYSCLFNSDIPRLLQILTRVRL